MSDRLPFFLHEALVALYVADSNGQPLGAALWSGAYANGLRFSHALDEVLVAASGDRYRTAYHVDEENVITIDRTWILLKTTLTDFMPGRNQQYVLQITWQQGNYVFQRTFYGVTGRNLDQNSVGTNQILTNQVFRAQYFTDTAAGAVSPPVTVVPAAPLALGFFRENPLLVNDYLLGFYTFAAPVTLVSAKVIAWAPQVSPVVLTLEVGGALTAYTLTIPVGAANVEVTANAALNLAVAANTLVRWQVTGAPGVANTAWHAAVLLQVQP
jgi:hypothetical protein